MNAATAATLEWIDEHESDFWDSRAEGLLAGGNEYNAAEELYRELWSTFFAKASYGEYLDVGRVQDVSFGDIAERLVNRAVNRAETIRMWGDD